MAEWLYFALPLAAGGLGLLLALRWMIGRCHTSSRQIYEVGFPRGLDSAAVEAFARGLSGLRPPRWRRVLDMPAVVWEVKATAGAITFVVRAEKRCSEFILGQLRAAIPSARVSQLQEPQSFHSSLAGELRLDNSRRQLNVDPAEVVSTAILATLRPLEADESMMVQWVISPADSPLPAAPKPTYTPTGNNPLLQAGRAIFGSNQFVPKTKGERDKRDGPHFHCSVRLGVQAANVARSRHLLKRLTAAFHTANAIGVGFRRRRIASSLTVNRIRRASTSLLAPLCYLNSKEIAALMGAPLGEVTLPGLALGRSRQLPAPSGLPQLGPAFAVSNYPGSTARLTFGLSSLPYHAWVIGPTGSGKSELLRNLIAAYIKLGASVIVFDSKAELARSVADLVPRNRLGDFVLLDPSDSHPIGINILSAANANAELVGDKLLGVFVKLWGDLVGPASQDTMRAVFITLAHAGYTLVEFSKLLLDDAWRRKIVSQLDDPITLEPFWGAFDSLSAGERAQRISAPTNKVRSILARRPLRDVVGQEHGLDLAEVLSRPSILSIALSKGSIGEGGAALFGSVLLTLIWGHLQGRASLPAGKRFPTLLILDEFQDYVSLPVSLGDLLAQARALNVGVICAHQHAAQLPTQLVRDLRSNARSQIAFGLAAPDARLFAEEFLPYLTADDLRGLDHFEVAARLCVDGKLLTPATGVTLPPPDVTGLGDKAREMSRERYGKDRATIEAEIRARHGERPGSGGLGQRRRAA